MDHSHLRDEPDQANTTNHTASADITFATPALDTYKPPDLGRSVPVPPLDCAGDVWRTYAQHEWSGVQRLFSGKVLAGDGRFLCVTATDGDELLILTPPTPAWLNRPNDLHCCFIFTESTMLFGREGFVSPDRSRVWLRLQDNRVSRRLV